MKTNVLIFPAGEVNSVELHDALSYNVNIEVFGASSVDRHGEYVFKNYRGGLPYIIEENFIDELNKLINEWHINFVFPTHDTIALFLSKNKHLINASIIVADYKTALICRDKMKTYRLFLDCDFCPHIYNEVNDFPVFVKPREGQGAKNAKLVECIEDVPYDFSSEDYVITEYLPGEEITVDCLTDNKGRLCACLPRKRNRILAGICVAGEALNVTERIMEISEIINNRMDFLGLWYYQLKKDAFGNYKLLEISTRCAGTMCLSRARGVNLPLLSVYAAMDKDISVFENPINIKVDRTFISRYKLDYLYDSVYVDYDDTIIVDGKVCIAAISFLYQSKNKKKKIILITRHDCDHNDTLEESMTKYNLSKSLFDKIIKITFEDKKEDYIKKDKAIFIDNAYSERMQVHNSLGIPVFDVEGIEVLFDWAI